MKAVSKPSHVSSVPNWRVTILFLILPCQEKGISLFRFEMLLMMSLKTLLHQTDLLVAHDQLLVPQGKISPHWKESLHIIIYLFYLDGCRVRLRGLC